jgi:hypothetical protein
MLYSFFWVIPQHLNLLFKQEEVFLLTPPMKMELTECSETLAQKIQTPENHPKERI